MEPTLITVAVIIPTRNRAVTLEKTLNTVAQQNYQPAEIIVIDASDNDDSMQVCTNPVNGLRSSLIWKKAEKRGAAVQRNQAMALTKMPFIGFMDDDVYLEANCIERIWNCFQTFDKVGGANALITNQQFHPLGRISRTVYSLFASKETLNNLEGKSIGPTVNFLSSEKNPEPFIRVDWLNLGLTIYRREALPDPVFDPHFKGYSFMEDAALSMIVSRNWKLYTVRDARIYHDSQPGDHKNNVEQLAEMELVNRYFIMTKIQHKNALKYKLQLIVFQLFYITASKKLFSISSWKGKFKAIKKILSKKLSANE